MQNNIINLIEPWPILIKMFDDFNNIYNILISDYIRGLLRLLINNSIDRKNLNNMFLLDNNPSAKKNMTIGKFNDIIKRNIQSKCCDMFIYNKYKKSWTDEEQYRIDYCIKNNTILLNIITKNSYILTYNILNNIYHINGLIYNLSSYIWPKCEYYKCIKLYVNPNCKCYHNEILDEKIQTIMNIVNINVEEASSLLESNNNDMELCVDRLFS